MMLKGKTNVRTIIITPYCPTVSDSSGGAYIQQLEALKPTRIQNDPRTQFWIDRNTEISKLIQKGEYNILMGDCNSESLEVNTCMKT